MKKQTGRLQITIVLPAESPAVAVMLLNFFHIEYFKAMTLLAGPDDCPGWMDHDYQANVRCEVSPTGDDTPVLTERPVDRSALHPAA